MISQISIRGGACPSRIPALIREARLFPHGRATNSESLGGVEGHASIDRVAPDMSVWRWMKRWPARRYSRFRVLPERPFSPDSSRDGFDVSRRQLAADVIVRSIFIQRAYSLRSNKVENPRTDSTDLLPGFFDASVFRTSPHGEQQTMRASYEHPFRTDNWSANERAH